MVSQDDDSVVVPIEIDLPKEAEREAIDLAIAADDLDQLPAYFWERIELDVTWNTSEDISEGEILRC